MRHRPQTSRKFYPARLIFQPQSKVSQIPNAYSRRFKTKSPNCSRGTTWPLLKEAGRTARASGLSPQAIGKFIGGFLNDDTPDSPRDDLPALSVLKLATEDLKAFYFEAMSAQPGQQQATSATLADWFWQHTTAGQVFFALQERGKDKEDRAWQVFSQLLLIPRAYQEASPFYK